MSEKEFNEAGETSLARAQRVARQAEEDRDRMWNFSLDLLCVANFDGWLEQVNPAWTKCLGWSVEELTSRPSIDFVHPDDRALTLDARGQVFEGKTFRNLQNRYLCKDGSFRWFSWNVHAFAETRKVFGVVRDITEQKKLESQFLRAQRMQSIGALAGGIAHDLNNTLSPIMMALELLKLRLPDADSQKVLAQVQASAQRGADLVRQVLSFARGVEGQRLVVDTVALMRQIKAVTKDSFPPSIAFELSAKPGFWNVTGDPTQLHQVFLNLCLNARDAMPRGGKLTVALENVVLDEAAAALNPDSRPGAYLAVRVADTGTGIPPDVLDKIFEPFFTTKEVGKGTGLGLSTVLTIVKSHGGFVVVESEPGRGTAFTVHLPANAERNAPEGPEPRDGPPRGAGELVLVVDDEEAIRVISSRALESFGYRVLAAPDGKAALALYGEHRGEVAAVLTDMSMPEMDGPALIRALRKLDPAVRIVAFSGLATKADAAAASGQAVRHFLGKPFTSDAMLRVLKAALTEPASD